jgi:hypothetical protein
MMHDEHLKTLLRAAAADIDVPAAPAEALARAGRTRRRRRRVVAGTAAAAAVAAAALAVPSLAPPSGPTSSPGRPAAAGSSGCVVNVPRAALPAWARAGFSDPHPRAAYVRSRNGDMVAILFAQPLSSPPSAEHSNKILWVARPEPAAATSSVRDPALRIRASLAGVSTTVTRVVPDGPGPSTIDLPEPGCWHLTLRWQGRSDVLDLAYSRPDGTTARP